MFTRKIIFVNLCYILTALNTSILLIFPLFPINWSFSLKFANFEALFGGWKKREFIKSSQCSKVIKMLSLTERTEITESQEERRNPNFPQLRTSNILDNSITKRNIWTFSKFSKSSSNLEKRFNWLRQKRNIQPKKWIKELYIFHDQVQNTSGEQPTNLSKKYYLFVARELSNYYFNPKNFKIEAYACSENNLLICRR